MFKRVKNFIYDVRINLDYPRYEREQKIEHERQAQTRFSTRELKNEITQLLIAIETKANLNFYTLILDKEKDKQTHESLLKNTEEHLVFFLRDYKEELNDLYSEKETLYSKKKQYYSDLKAVETSLSNAFSEKKSLHLSLRNYERDIKSWHAKSKRTTWLGGNSGKKIPKHSFFGQSFGDLDSLKSHRNSTYHDIQTLKRKISSLQVTKKETYHDITLIKLRIDDIASQIEQVKADRSKLYELKKSGFQKEKLQEELKGFKDIIDSLSSQIDTVSKNKEEFILQEKYRLGVIDLESKTRKVDDERTKFIKTFQSDEHKKLRKLTHRKLWLEQKGVV
jgi:hypothetical protein